MLDEVRGQLVVDFVQLLKLSSAGFDGQPFALQPWQKQLVVNFYGAVDRDGEEVFRHYQYLYLEIPKKTERRNWRLLLDSTIYWPTAKGTPRCISCPRIRKMPASATTPCARW